MNPPEEFLKARFPDQFIDGRYPIDTGKAVIDWDDIFEAMKDYGEECRTGGNKELLCDFFKYFRDNGEANIGMTIEQFVDEYLKNGE